MMKSDPKRGAIYAKLHIARKELGLPDDAYRDILHRLTGHYSARDASTSALETVLAHFRTLGWKPKKGSLSSSDKPHVRMIYAIWKDMGPFLKSSGTREALRAYVQRQTVTPEHPDGISAPEFLDGVQGRKVIEGLKQWKARLERGLK
ncbi:regulatory protein GemA [Gluconacetobacter entanii]|uniref:Regulatory protein GemA n=1 Tax=Gluconacetobacter entanii TaxID=108528 RepID=A0ABT3K1S8_9PROT|nr:regulatory protein GemA [Gluconacetobacter entanii]MCW4589368.1 regulatory protein GemA [Gluconacetobacter entanii]MCW4592999.1 regulatory protein GemA [Gluconacetobacter entanii]NPC90225.1 regulatory protein GemA [Gluconacetobacter entanii]